jgi:hypothetical protein
VCGIYSCAAPVAWARGSRDEGRPTWSTAPGCPNAPSPGAAGAYRVTSTSDGAESNEIRPGAAPAPTKTGVSGFNNRMTQSDDNHFGEYRDQAVGGVTRAREERDCVACRRALGRRWKAQVPARVVSRTGCVLGGRPGPRAGRAHPWAWTTRSYTSMRGIVDDRRGRTAIFRASRATAEQIPLRVTRRGSADDAQRERRRACGEAGGRSETSGAAQCSPTGGEARRRAMTGTPATIGRAACVRGHGPRASMRFDFERPPSRKRSGRRRTTSGPEPTETCAGVLRNSSEQGHGLRVCPIQRPPIVRHCVTARNVPRVVELNCR